MGKNIRNTHVLVSVAMLSAVASILMFFSFSVPLVPSFMKIDFSELPALIAAFAFGPIAGVLVCLVKNAVNLFFTTTGGIGELSNFLLGATFTFVAGAIYKYYKSKSGAVIAGIAGAICMALISVALNYYIIYPLYTNLMPFEVIMSLYQIIRPSTETLYEALIVFNMPFTFFKAMLNVIIAIVIYKPLSPIIKGASMWAINRMKKT